MARITQKTNQVFLGCNYSNKKVKQHFEKLKGDWEEHWPIRVVLVDKEKENGAGVLWTNIKKYIEESALTIFDVTAFRPNVVLELGYALSVKKDLSSVVISFCTRRNIGEKKDPEWQLSDISNLKRITYNTLAQLDKSLEENLMNVPIVERFNNLKKKCNTKGRVGEKYETVCLNVLKELLADKKLSDSQIRKLHQGYSIQFEQVTAFLRKHNLAYRGQGAYGKWGLVDNK